MQLHEQYRPRSWSDVIGQKKVVARVESLRKRGLAGRAFWISGQSGTGKTTIARLIAAEVADPINVEEIDAGDLTADRLREIDRRQWSRCLGQRNGRGFASTEHVANKQLTTRRATLPQTVTAPPSGIAGRHPHFHFGPAETAMFAHGPSRDVADHHSPVHGTCWPYPREHGP